MQDMSLPSPENKYDVVIIGGGASGLAAAISAAHTLYSQNKNARVAVLESDIACGKKILATGNGRCNLSNTQLTLDRYNNTDFCNNVFAQARSALMPQMSSVEELIDTFFSRLGLLTTTQDGRLYPYSLRAESVRDVLLHACNRARVHLLCNHHVEEVSFFHGQWNITAQAPIEKLTQRKKEDDRKYKRRVAQAAHASISYQAAAVIFAAGNLAFDSDSYLTKYAYTHGVQLKAPEPVLCPIACKDAHHDLSQLDAMRVICTAHLIRNTKHLYAEKGEILFRSYGLSGVCIFNLSRRIQPGDTISLNLMPHMQESELDTLLRNRTSTLDYDQILCGIFGNQVAQCLMNRAHTYANENACDLLSALAHTITHLEFEVMSTCEHKQAQVLRGGIDVSHVSTQDLSINSTTAYACGEIIDVDADCGGYNLAWAWVSGLLAGFSAAKATAQH